MMILADPIQLPGEAHGHLLHMLHAARGIALSMEAQFHCGGLSDPDMAATAEILSDILTAALKLAEQ